MILSNYSIGRNYEYRAKRILESYHFIVIRSAGSHSFVDLIALREDYCLAIQVKSTNDEKRIPAILKEIDMSLKEIVLPTYIQFETWVFIKNESKPRVYSRNEVCLKNAYIKQENRPEIG